MDEITLDLYKKQTKILETCYEYRNPERQSESVDDLAVKIIKIIKDEI